MLGIRRTKSVCDFIFLQSVKWLVTCHTPVFAKGVLNKEEHWTYLLLMEGEKNCEGFCPFSLASEVS
jgi:hypothetical protein